MQSIGVYWIPLCEILEERGLKVYLVNARHTKNLPEWPNHKLPHGRSL
jgi:transposase